MIKCKKCGNNLNERGKDFDIHLTEEQEKLFKENTLEQSPEVLDVLGFKCLKCNTKLSLMDLCASMDDELKDIVYATKSQSKNGSV